MATNSESIKLDVKKRILGGKSAPVNTDGVLAYKPFGDEWINLDPTAFTVDASNSYITTTDPTRVDMRTIFRVGDRILTIQDSDESQFYVIAVFASYIEVVTGAPYGLLDQALESFQKSSAILPLGFDRAFPYTPGSLTLNSASSLSISNAGTTTSDFRLVGDMCYLTLNRVGVVTTGAGSAAGFLEALPIPASSQLGYRSWVSALTATTYGNGLANVAMNTSIGTGVVSISPVGVNVIAGTTTYTITIFYPIE